MLLGRRAVQYGPHHRHRLDLSENGLAGRLPASLATSPTCCPWTSKGTRLRAAAASLGKLAQLQTPPSRPESALRRAPPRAGDPGEAQDPGPPVQPDHRQPPRRARQPREPPDPQPRGQPDLGEPPRAARDPALADLPRPLGEPAQRRDPGRALGTLGGCRRSISTTTSSPARSPPRWGACRRSRQLGLSDNQLTGRIPGELGNLPQLMFLNLERTSSAAPVPARAGQRHLAGRPAPLLEPLGGTIPARSSTSPTWRRSGSTTTGSPAPSPSSSAPCPRLDDNGGLDLRFNALATDTEPGLLADLNPKQAGGNWTSSQAAAAPLDPQIPLDGLADRRTGGFVYWTLPIAAGAPPLTVSDLFPGNGNVDLYVPLRRPADAHPVRCRLGELRQPGVVTVASPRQGTVLHRPLRALSLHRRQSAGSGAPETAASREPPPSASAAAVSRSRRPGARGTAGPARAMRSR